MNPAAPLACWGVTHQYGSGQAARRVLQDVGLRLEPGDACLLMGPSGSGKTTLLCILGCLLRPTRGTVHLAGHFVDHGNRRLMDEARRRQVGFVFQHSRLLPFLTGRENLEVQARNAGLARAPRRRRLARLAAELGVEAVLDQLPGTMSGGERQRIAIARALVSDPVVLLADEPTASLDWENARRVVEMITTHVRETGSAALVVTHDQRLAGHFGKVHRLEEGRLCVGGLVPSS